MDPRSLALTNSHAALIRCGTAGQKRESAFSPDSGSLPSRPRNGVRGLYYQLAYKGSLAAHGFDGPRANFPRQPVPVCNKILKCCVGAGQVQTRRTTATAPTIEVLPDRHGYRYSVNLGTNWEKDWQRQPNAATTLEEQASVVNVLKPKISGITATCFQYHVYGRSTGLKIRWKVVSKKWTAGDQAKRISALLTTFSVLLLYRGDAAIGVGSSPTFGNSNSRSPIHAVAPSPRR